MSYTRKAVLVQKIVTPNPAGAELRFGFVNSYFVHRLNVIPITVGVVAGHKLQLRNGADDATLAEVTVGTTAPGASVVLSDSVAAADQKRDAGTTLLLKSVNTDTDAVYLAQVVGSQND